MNSGLVSGTLLLTTGLLAAWSTYTTGKSKLAKDAPPGKQRMRDFILAGPILLFVTLVIMTCTCGHKTTRGHQTLLTGDCSFVLSLFGIVSFVSLVTGLMRAKTVTERLAFAAEAVIALYAIGCLSLVMGGRRGGGHVSRRSRRAFGMGDSLVSGASTATSGASDPADAIDFDAIDRTASMGGAGLGIDTSSSGNSSASDIQFKGFVPLLPHPGKALLEGGKAAEAVSALSSTAVRATTHASGASDVSTKPMNASQLFSQTHATDALGRRVDSDGRADLSLPKFNR